MAFVLEGWKYNMEKVKVTGKNNKRIMERYADHNGKIVGKTEISR